MDSIYLIESMWQEGTRIFIDLTRSLLLPIDQKILGSQTTELFPSSGAVNRRAQFDPITAHLRRRTQTGRLQRNA